MTDGNPSRGCSQNVTKLYVEKEQDLITDKHRKTLRLCHNVVSKMNCHNSSGPTAVLKLHLFFDVYTFQKAELTSFNSIVKLTNRNNQNFRFHRTMRSHSWLILLVVLCTTQVFAGVTTKAKKGDDESPTTAATNVVKSSVTEDVRYCTYIVLE